MSASQPEGSQSQTLPMFDDFSEKTKGAVEAAREVAERLGDRSVATGHLIYGLTKDLSVSLHYIFKDLNVDPDMFAEYVQSLPREPESHDGGVFNRHSRTAFDRAREMAQEVKSKLVEPEHLAIAILSIKAGSCYETLKEFAIEPEYVTTLIMESMGLEDSLVPDWF